MGDRVIIRIVSYSKRGAGTAGRIADGLRSRGHGCRCFTLPAYCPPGAEPLELSARQWAEEGFRKADALIFCCAAGITVRAIAPWVKSKKEDPAVVVVDELGRFVIPLLSGHLGGANELALMIAENIEAIPVVTTATDLNGVFAVDMFAKKNHLCIEDMQLAKEVSAALLAGKPVGFCSDMPCLGQLPAGLTKENAKLGICITKDTGKTPYNKTMRLLPKRYAAGLGCRRGKRAEEMEAFFLQRLADCGVEICELRCIASIDLKAGEPGLVTLCKKYGLPYLTYTAEQLNSVPGSFSGSEFVKKTTGVDSVCERAAVLASGGNLIERKTAVDGMTFALAEYEEAIRFE